MAPFITKRILKKHGTSLREAEDSVAVEKKLRVSVNGREALSLYCTPLMIRELITGFLLTEGIIEGSFCAEEISVQFLGEDIIVDVPAEGELKTEGFTVTSGCAGGVTFGRRTYAGKIDDGFSLRAAAIEKLFRDFQERGELYRLTGCVHSAALSDDGKILVFAEDIGRHNAVDKVIGHCILEGIPLTQKLMLVSGRLSSEIAAKCSIWRIPIVASRTAPTDRAIKIAEETGATLVGFVRGERMNIYSNPQRIIV